MATFTMYLHELLGVDNPRDADPSLIGLDDYPIWDDGYRGELNHKIMMRFWNREIGAETPFEFVHNVRRVMGEIMPYYNKLAETTLWDFDPFETINMDTTSSSSSSGDSQQQSTDEGSQQSSQTGRESTASDSQQSSESANRAVAYEHPQTQLTGNEDYATSSQESKTGSTSDTASSGSGASETQQQGVTSGESKSSSSNTSDGQSAGHQRGFQGDRAALLQSYRDTIVGVDTQILEELEQVFMGIYDNGDTYTSVEPYPYPFYFPYW